VTLHNQKWSIPDPERWKHPERVSTKRMVDTLNEIRTAREQMQDLKYDLNTRIEAKQRTMISVWHTAYTQQMHEFERELTALTKEVTRLNRLIQTCTQREEFMASMLEMLKVQVDDRSQ